MVMELVKRDIEMKVVKIILVIIITAMLSFCGYYGYNYFKKWEVDRFSEINMLKTNQELFLKTITALSETITHIANDVVKTTTTLREVGSTYEGLKERIIELKKDEEVNKDEIAELREQLSEQRQAFLASDNTILIKTTNDDTLLIYRDTEDTLQPASDNIVKIIEHRELSSIVPILPEEEIAINKTKLNLKAGGYYDFSGTYGVILSKSIINIKKYSLNASLLLSDYKNFKFAVGADVGYKVGDFELGVGYNTNKDYYVKLQYSF